MLLSDEFDVELELDTCEVLVEPVTWTSWPISDASEEVSPESRQWLPASSIRANELSALFWLRQPSITLFWLSAELLLMVELCVLLVEVAGGAELSGGMVCAGCSGRCDASGAVVEVDGLCCD